MEIATIYSDFKGILLGYIRTKVSDMHDAEDILQNTFVKVASNLDSVHRQEKLQAWIFAIARNTIADHYRKKGSSVSGQFDEELSETTPEPVSTVIATSLDCCLMNFLDQLPGEYRDILIDVELKDVKQKDLVDKYKLAYPSIRSRVQRGREKLKQVLLSCCDIATDSRGNLLEVTGKKCDPSSSKTCKR